MIAFFLGALAAAFVLVVGAIAVGVTADAAGWASFRVGIGRVLLFEFERRAASTGTTVGTGVPLMAAACGLLNAAGAAVLGARRG